MTTYTGKHKLYTSIGSMHVTQSVLKKLEHQGMKYTRHLLEHGSTQQGREALASTSRLSLDFITLLVCQADLMRLKAVGGNLSFLLLRAGIANCRILQYQNAEQLHSRLAILQREHQLSSYAPKVIQVRSWIDEAKFLADTSPDTSLLGGERLEVTAGTEEPRGDLSATHSSRSTTDF